MPSKVPSARRARFIDTAFSELPEFRLFGGPDTATIRDGYCAHPRVRIYRGQDDAKLDVSDGCCTHSGVDTDVRTTRAGK